jgi:formiminotetrahydrofolate cyclodeaminase
MDIQKSISQYLDDISSNSPTPGGGNVSAFCGSVASSLGSMVCNLTIGKKKYAEVEEEVKSLQKELDDFKESFLTLAKHDNDAFDEVMTAYKLPKETESEKLIRMEAIDNATFHAAFIPSEVIRNCMQALPLVLRISEIGNKNSISDAGVALLLIRAAAEGAYLNVLINCSSLTHVQEAKDLLAQTTVMVENIKVSIEERLEEIVEGMRTHV